MRKKDMCTEYKDAFVSGDFMLSVYEKGKL